MRIRVFRKFISSALYIKDTLMYELGYRFMLWKGFSFRIGLIVLSAEGSSTELNPTPGISDSHFF